MKGPFKAGQEVRIRPDLGKFEGKSFGGIRINPKMAALAGRIGKVLYDDTSAPFVVCDVPVFGSWFFPDAALRKP